MACEADMQAQVRRWLEEVVIGLGLCPFAVAPWRTGSVRIVISDARTRRCLLSDLHGELMRLDAESPQTLETTLVAAPHLLRDFGAFNEFLDLAEGLIEQFGWRGHYQIASFHPDYRFVGAAADDPGNLTNRSPCPIFHLLREESIERALSEHPNTEEIPARNIACMQALTESERLRLFPFLPARVGA
jgi:hypothetical protein